MCEGCACVCGHSGAYRLLSRLTSPSLRAGVYWYRFTASLCCCWCCCCYCCVNCIGGIILTSRIVCSIEYSRYIFSKIEASFSFWVKCFAGKCHANVLQDILRILTVTSMQLCKSSLRLSILTVLLSILHLAHLILKVKYVCLFVHSSTCAYTQILFFLLSYATFYFLYAFAFAKCQFPYAEKSVREC